MIQVVAPNPQWSEFFVTEADKIQSVLGSNCAKVHWIGSTSVPALAAKPIIDMIPQVHDIQGVDACREGLEALGYESHGEFGMAFRRFFRKTTTQPGYHVHCFEYCNDEIERHLRFRNYMRAHPEARTAYGDLKAELAQKFPQDPKSYGTGKLDFIHNIERQTGFQATRMVIALLDSEWAAYRKLRNILLFDPQGIRDPFTDTFKAPGHWHYVLYHGPDVIGGAHLERISETEATVRALLIDPKFKDQGYDQTFQTWLERWLTHQGLVMQRSA